MKIIVVLALAVMVLLSACGGGGEEEQSATTFAGEAATEAPSVEPSTPGPERTDVPPVSCEPLITDDEVDVALGVTGLPSMMRFAGGEACNERLANDGDFFVEILPGDPSDFEAGASLMGVSGQPVGGVGDEALWFGGGDAEGGGSVGALSVHQDTSLGALHFRIALGRPDLDSAAQLEVAKTVALSALPRFPGVKAGYVDNLLVKEAAGEWTRGEGLVATLGLFAGEAEADSVLRHPELGDFSGTGVVQMAREYLEEGSDSEAKAEIERLLDFLVPSREQLEAMAGIGVQAMAPGIQAASFYSAQGEGGCAAYWGAGDPCISEAVSPKLDEEYPDKYKLWVPDESTQETEGWTEEHLLWALDAMESAAIAEEDRGAMPERVHLMFTPFDYPTAMTYAESDVCSINLNKPMQQLGEEAFKQRIASEMADCNLLIEESSDNTDECVLDGICGPSDYFSAAPG
jgi:hypothetical protein